MASTIDDFFAYLHREETLPKSGLKVLIRIHPDLEAFVGLGELPIPAAPASASEPTDAVPAPTLTAREVNRYTERLIASAVISPPFSDARDDQGKPIYSAKHYVHVSELDTEDRTYLAQVLFKAMGLTTEDAVAVHAFREDQVSPDDQGVGVGVQLPSQ